MRTTTRILTTLTTVIVGAGILAGCSSQTPPAAPEAVEFGHTHGLGYDASTGIVFAATHNGVWELPTSRLPSSFGSGSLVGPPGDVPELIGDRRQDTMGFLVVDGGLLLGSGHPDPETDPTAPANLGFITSENAANDWTSVALTGETDFHDIAATALPTGALRVYGYDATKGVILTSDDSGSTWTPGAALDLRDLAIDPTNPDRIYATTAAGLQISDDIARTFTTVPDAPPLFLIDHTDTGYVGVDTAGTIWGNDGAGWAQGGTVTGEPQALSFVGGSEPWLLFSDDRGVFATPDLGVTLIPLAEMP